MSSCEWSSYPSFQGPRLKGQCFFHLIGNDTR